jgi:hydroxyethylthiazole kinase-like uncharacterized protein yjeF
MSAFWNNAWPDDLASVDEMRSYDRQAIALGISGTDLMERAGTGIANEIVELTSPSSSIVVFCGPGNNGGDGLVIGRRLKERGFCVTTVVCCDGKLTEEVVTQIKKSSNTRIFGKLPGGVESLGTSYVDSTEVAAMVRSADVVVDALLGIGQEGEPRGVIARVLELVSQSVCGAVFFSVDVPTGVNADTGVVYRRAIHATRTYAIECVKRGLSQYPARELCGLISVVPIGIRLTPPTESKAIHRGSFPVGSRRASDAHKGDLGRVLIIGGSRSMSGAGMLAALGALRAGAGIVSRVVRASWPFVPPLPECMFEVVEGDDPSFNESDVEAILVACQRYDSLVVGPGIGCSVQTVDFLEKLLKGLLKFEGKIVFDADALNCMTQILPECRLGINSVITPHPGEAARLLGVTVAEVQANRFVAVDQLVSKMGCTVVLKGPGTLVSDGNGTHVVTAGNPILATPGSGDVLAGTIATTIVQSRDVLKGALYGAWLHASAGDLLAAEGRTTTVASEIGGALSRVS